MPRCVEMSQFAPLPCFGGQTSSLLFDPKNCFKAVVFLGP